MRNYQHSNSQKKQCISRHAKKKNRVLAFSLTVLMILNITTLTAGAETQDSSAVTQDSATAVEDFSTDLNLSLNEIDLENLEGGQDVDGNGTYSDGYMFEMKDGTTMLLDAEMPEGINHVYDNLYTAESLSEITDFVSADCIESVVPDCTISLCDYSPRGETKPNDTYYEVYQKTKWEMIGADESWRKGIDGSGVRVAVIDSGFGFGTGSAKKMSDFDYEKIDAGYNYTATSGAVESEKYNLADDVGHGTAIGSMLCSISGNSKGMAGMAEGVTLVPLKAYSAGSGKVSYCIKAIREAVDVYHCDVINMSWKVNSSGSYGETEMALLHDAIKYAYDKGVILVASAGNDGALANGTELQYPAAFDEVISVGSVDDNKAVSSFSQRNSGVFITAPGNKICAKYLTTGAVTYNYQLVKGTSFTAPEVSAAAALMKQIYDEKGKKLTGSKFAELLSQTAIDLGAEGRDDSYGYGLLNIPGMIKVAEEGTVCQKDIIFLDSDNNEISLLSNDDETFTAVLSVDNNISQPINSSIVAAAYNANGKQIEVHMSDATLAGFSENKVSSKFTNKDGDITSVKFFTLKNDGSWKVLS